MEDKIVRLLEDTENIIRKLLPEGYYLDDSGWGDDRFRVCIWKDYGIVDGRPKCAFFKGYTFVYHADDERDLAEQYNDWLDDTVWWIDYLFSE